MSFVRCLKCKECGAEYPLEPRVLCDHDFAPVEVDYDYDNLRLTRAKIEAGPPSLWRYRDLLPIQAEPLAGLRSGWTPLVPARRLAAELGLREVYIKDDSANYPSFSYKDRVVSVALTRAVEFGFTTVGCASTGNLAHSLAAHAAAAGLESFVVIPEDLEAAKIVASAVFGASVYRVSGNYDDVNRLCNQIADHYGWAIVNVNLRPYYTEGAKTFGFEIAEQNGWKLPDHTVLPVAGGTILPKVAKAYQEFVRLGLVEEKTARIHAAQAAGCNPVATALEKGSDIILPQKPRTLAKSIAIGSPADGEYAVRAVRQSGGRGVSVSDAEILEAIELLARTEGIFTEPAGGTTVAAALRLVREGVVKSDESLCIGITGNGLKTIEVLEGRQHLAPVIPARISEFIKLKEGVAA